MPAGRPSAGRSPEAQAYRGLYSTAPWRRLRARVLARDCYTCQRCGRLDNPRRLIADHKTAHKGDLALFWKETNVETLCKPCHDGPKQMEEATGKANTLIGYSRDVGEDGMPTDPNHPWNREA